MAQEASDRLEVEGNQGNAFFTLLCFIVVLSVLVFLFGSTGSGHGFGGGSGGGVGAGDGVGSGAGDGGGDGDGDGSGEGDGDGGGFAATGAGYGDSDLVPEMPGHAGDVKETVTPTTEPAKTEIPPELPKSNPEAEWSASALKISGNKQQDTQEQPAEIRTRAPAGVPGGGGGGGGIGKPMGTGDVSFRIYWHPKEHDIDLHVLDPAGHHIWFQRKGCDCGGQLDRDDTSRGGPENIFWPENRAPEGEYLYWVHYYQGSGTKFVTIEIRRDGELTETKKVRLANMGDESERFKISHVKNKNINPEE
ncbi:MAG: hypothetical protein JW808_01985 [Victivallales bacterium]|nr:hypothetical protein [Victivallales bacterium]